MRDGRLEQIYRRWGIWDDGAGARSSRAQAHAAGRPPSGGARRVEPRQPMTAYQATLRYLPAVFRASLITIVLSCLSMALAVLVGIARGQRARSTATACCARRSRRTSR